MTGRKFIFTLQPALDKAQEEKRQWEHSVAQAQRDLAQEEERLAAFQKAWFDLMQQARAAADKLLAARRGPVATLDMLAGTTRVEALSCKRRSQGERISAQKAEVEQAQVRLRLRREELNRASADFQALDRLKERQMAEHRQALERYEQAQTEEAVILRYGRP